MESGSEGCVETGQSTGDWARSQKSCRLVVRGGGMVARVGVEASVIRVCRS